jgi:hypothetical protein
MYLERHLAAVSVIGRFFRELSTAISTTPQSTLLAVIGNIAFSLSKNKGKFINVDNTARRSIF